jgi:hypothetical protein
MMNLFLEDEMVPKPRYLSSSDSANLVSCEIKFFVKLARIGPCHELPMANLGYPTHKIPGSIRQLGNDDVPNVDFCALIEHEESITRF